MIKNETYVKLQHPVSGKWWDKTVKRSYREVREIISGVLGSGNGEFKLGDEVFPSNVLKQMVITVRTLED